MRVQNSVKNMLFGISGQIISIIMGFTVRTVFIYTLGVEYLGVEGLFSSILILLSLANLGFDTAMSYSLYKPLAIQDVNKIQALIHLYKRAYQWIGLVVLLIGLSLMPFLPYLMNGETTVQHIQIIYLLFLLHSVSSYFFSYKHAVIAADQRSYIISKIHSIFTIISNSAQIILLLTTKYYLAVLAAQIAFRIVENVYTAKKADRLYPYLAADSDARLTKSERKSFFENLYAQTLYKISAVVIIGTDNIVISMFVGLTWVGIYSNYLLIIGMVSTLVSYLFHSITASVGNLIVNESTEKKHFIFRALHFANFWIYGFCAVSLWTLMNPFITIWLGKQYLFDLFVVFAIVLNFFTAGMQDAPTIFRETTGLFKKGKYRPIIAAAINIVASILLAREIGVAGVLLGTVISRLCTYFWYDPYVVYKYAFHKKAKSYFLRYIWLASVVFAAAYISSGLGSMVHTNPLSDFLIRGFLCLTVPNVIFFLLFRRSEEFRYLREIVTQLGSKIFVRSGRRKVAKAEA
ncbi:sugar translocase [Cohnella kolymensis]|uniref:Sugar translocase n=1 Tax=Cohnella kolymensis TaxID=1590652 RepID=A0ABR5A2W0_9BACL|nr:sugar translocase [Cohnella kolymensis]KIL35402.1 sugar translocase [Cohnella kolymensis]